MFVPYAPRWTIATSTPNGASSYDDASARASSAHFEDEYATPPFVMFAVPLVRRLRSLSELAEVLDDHDP